MNEMVIDFSDMQDYLQMYLVHLGYAPSEDELYDVIDGIIEFLTAVGGLVMIDDKDD